MSEASVAAADPQVPYQSVGAIAVRDTNVIGQPMPPGMGFPAGPAESAADGGIDGRRVLHAVRRRWLPAVVLGTLAATAIGIPTWLLMPRGFEAVVWLRIRDKGGMLGGGRDALEYEAYRKTQLQLLKSPLVLNSALRRPGISSLKTITDEDDPVTWLAKALDPHVQAESEVLQLKLRAPLAEDAAKILNAVTQCYLDDIVNKDRQERLGRRDMLEKKYKENQTELRSRRETFNELARTLGTRDSTEVATQRSLLLDHLGTLRSTVVTAERDLNMIDTELAVLGMAKASDGDAEGETEAAEEEIVSDELVELMLSREADVSELEDQLAALTTAILSQSERSARGLNEPAVKRMRVQRDQVARQIDALKEKLRPQVLEMLSQSGGAIQSTGGAVGGRTAPSAAVLKVRREALVRTIESTRKELEQVTKEVTMLGQANADIEVRKGEIEQLQRVTDQIGLQLESTALDLTAPPRVTLLEEASVPESADFLRRVFLTALASAAGLVLGAGSVILVEYMRNRLSAAEEVPRRAGVRLIGTLPWVGKTKKGRANEYRLAESIDSIRTLVLQGGRESPKVIMVTSPAEREGKSSVAANLAASIARADKRTLLLEGSLRNPSVHAALQLDPSTPGMAELLRGETTGNEVIQPTAIDGLFAVASGAVDYAAINALSRPELGRILQGFRDSFDHVVIDAGPVLAYADTLLIGQGCDVTLLAVMRDVSSVAAISAAVDRLRSAGVRVLGCVVSGTPEATPKAWSQRLPA